MNLPKRKIFVLLMICFISINLLTISKAFDNSQKPFDENEANVRPFTSSFRVSQNETDSIGFFDPDNVSAFLAEFISNLRVYDPQFQPFPIIGGAVSIVKDGELFLAEGFGNSSSDTLISANETLFRVGSISKAFIAVAVLQLVEDGRLDLNVDINTYLNSFKIPATFKEPITLLHLLTHTTGFESTSYISSYADPSSVPSLEEVLNASIPNRVRPVGEVATYSNYGAALAGFIVEQVSGVTFDDYIEQNILISLEMNHSTFKQPLPSALLSNLSENYYLPLTPANFSYITLYPGDSLSSTPTDMAKFMIALLDNGSTGSNGILDYDSLTNMRSNHFTWHPSLSGVSLGLYHFDSLNQSVIGHVGVVDNYYSIMALIPEENIGIFITCNTQYGIDACWNLLYGLRNQYYPYDYVNSTDATIVPLKNYRNRVSRYTGMYMHNERVFSENSFQFEVSASENGTIVIDNQGQFWRGIHFVEVEPLLFREYSGTYDITIAFGTDKQGRVTRMYPSWFSNPTSGFDKIHPWYDPIELQSLFIMVISILSLGSFVGWGFVAYSKMESSLKADKAIIRVVRWYILPVYLISQLFLIAFNSRISSKTVIISEMTSFFSDLLPLIYLLAIMILILIPLVILAWWGNGNHDNSPYWSKWSRVHYTILVALYLGFFWLYTYWMFI